MNPSSNMARLAVGIAAIFGLAVVLFAKRRPGSSASPPVPSPRRSVASVATQTDPALGRLSPELARDLLAIEDQEREIAESVWAVESLASSCGAVFESFWDRLNASTSKWEVARSLPSGTLRLPRWQTESSGPHGIVIRTPSGPGPTWAPEAWSTAARAWQNEGWAILQCEFRHVRFETNTGGSPARSRFSFSVHLTRTSPPARAVLEGPLDVEWSPPATESASPRPAGIDASALELRIRPGPASFIPVLAEPISLPRHSLSVDPLLVRDLDDDGFPELLLIARGILFRRDRTGVFRSEPIAPASAFPDVVHAAVLADLDGDRRADLVVQTLQSLLLLPGLPGGTFSPTPRVVWRPPVPLNYPMVLTTGDIDGDGDTDVFLGQYKEPYEGGSSPTPYFASNDGYPAYLLVNQGHGRFDDATTRSGLEAKRFRRIYSASLSDLDEDGDLDLVTVSDFAGLDLFRNDGKGVFSDVTRDWVAKPFGFGMAQTRADFDADGRLDLLMIGMPSPTVDRLEHLGLHRPDSHQDSARRADMSFGNRLYLAQPEGGFLEGALGLPIARTGWSWGCAAADFDNDGFVDLAIVNGLESKSTVRDYESEYWLHDQHVGRSTENAAAYFYFKSKIARTRGRGMSYGGYEKNRLFLNLSGTNFLEVGHLFGVALEQDCRNLVTEDVDGDGRMDLIVLGFEKWPEAKPTLRIFRNELSDVGSWIGFRPRFAADGTRVSLTAGHATRVREIVSGDSYRSQHSGIVHFGLGSESSARGVSFRWPSGSELFEGPLPANRYYPIELSERAAKPGGDTVNGKE